MSNSGIHVLKNDQRERFAQEYSKEQNATQAAIRAGYSPKTAAQQGSRLLANKEVRNRVDYLIEQASREAIYDVQATAEFLRQARDLNIAEIVEIVNGCDELPKDEVYKINGSTLNILDSQRAVINQDAYKKFGRFIEEITPTAHGLKIKFVDKKAAAKMLGDFQGAWQRNQAEDTNESFDFPADPNDPAYDKMLDELE